MFSGIQQRCVMFAQAQTDVGGFLSLLAFQYDLRHARIQRVCDLGAKNRCTCHYARPCGTSTQKMQYVETQQILEIRALIASFLALELQALMQTSRQAAHEILYR